MLKTSSAERLTCLMVSQSTVHFTSSVMVLKMSSLTNDEIGNERVL